MQQIQDGTGKGNLAKVDSNQRLYTNAVTREEVELSIFLGNGYNINTGLITITNAGVDNGVWYLKNNGTDDVVIHEMLIILGTSTGGVGDGTLKVFRNPTTGTLISGALAVEANVNRNFSSSNAMEVLTYKGVTAATVTDGTTLGSTNRSGASVINFTSTPFILKTGNSIGVTWAAATSNTSQSVRIATTAFVRTNDI
jgi:sRNA-binding regulator protein Hfq